MPKFTSEQKKFNIEMAMYFYCTGSSFVQVEDLLAKDILAARKKQSPNGGHAQYPVGYPFEDMLVFVAGCKEVCDWLTEILKFLTFKQWRWNWGGFSPPAVKLGGLSPPKI